jgi:hypothetical protein
LVVRSGATDVATPRLTLPAADVRRLSRVRAPREEVLRVGKAPLGLRGGQARSVRAQLHQMTCCVVACGVLERERQPRGLRLDNLTRPLSCRGQAVLLSALAQLKNTA